MVSLGVLTKEKELCDEIIKYKKKKDLDQDTFDFKKESIDDKIGLVTSYIQDGLWDFEMYKTKIKEQYAWESRLLLYVDKDTSLKEEQKNKIKERVNNRKKIIEDELQRNPEQEAAEEEAKSKDEATAEKPVQSSDITISQSSTSSNQSVDFYPEKVENKYHDVAKMESLGVLEKEIEICDLVIGYKKKKGEDYDTWEFKKDTIGTKKETITTAIENGIVDFEGYKKKIKSQHLWESKLLIFVEKDKTLVEAQKKIIIQRINNRKKIIEEELAKNIDEEEVKEEPKPKEEPKKKST